MNKKVGLATTAKTDTIDRTPTSTSDTHHPTYKSQENGKGCMILVAGRVRRGRFNPVSFRLPLRAVVQPAATFFFLNRRASVLPAGRSPRALPLSTEI